MGTSDSTPRHSLRIHKCRQACLSSTSPQTFHLPPTKTKFTFGWNSSPCHAPHNHPGKRSSLNCLPSRKRKAEKTIGILEPFSQTFRLQPPSAQPPSTALVPWESISPRTNRFNDNNPSTNLWQEQTASSPAYGIADICEILDDTNCAHTDGEDEKMELN